MAHSDKPQCVSWAANFLTPEFEQNEWINELMIEQTY